MTAEKTEQPTPKKLRDAKKKGQVAKSKEVSGTISFVFIVGTLWFMSDRFINTIMEMVLLPSTVYNEPFKDGLKIVVMGLLMKSISLLWPLIIVAMFGAIAGNILQFGFVFSGEPIKPDIKKISPVGGFKKIFSMNNLAEFIKSIIKITVLSIVVYWVIKNDLKDLVKLPYCGSPCILPVAGVLLKKLLLYAIATFVVIAVVDFIFEKHQFLKKNKMTKDEVKREYRESEGDPEIKQKRKEIHHEILNETENTKKSDVIIKNPTHLAIGLHYDQEKTPLPIVMVKGKNARARSIIKIAQKNDIPILENVPLAHALFEGDIASYIPSDLISPVAEVFRWVEDLKEKHNQIK